jgi:hypothetical protein
MNSQFKNQKRSSIDQHFFINDYIFNQVRGDRTWPNLLLEIRRPRIGPYMSRGVGRDEVDSSPPESLNSAILFLYVLFL